MTPLLAALEILDSYLVRGLERKKTSTAGRWALGIRPDDSAYVNIGDPLTKGAAHAAGDVHLPLADCRLAVEAGNSNPWRAVSILREALLWIHSGEHEWSAPPDALRFIERALIQAAKDIEGRK